MNYLSASLATAGLAVKLIRVKNKYEGRSGLRRRDVSLPPKSALNDQLMAVTPAGVVFAIVVAEDASRVVGYLTLDVGVAL